MFIVDIKEKLAEIFEKFKLLKGVGQLMSNNVYNLATTVG